MTLVELLVVMAMIGVLIAGVGFALGQAGRADGQVEAERLASGIESVALVARSSGRKMAMSFDGEGYQFWRREADGAWSALGEGEFAPHRFPDGIVIASLRANAQPVLPATRLEFGLTPALLDLTLRANGRDFHISGSPTGRVSVKYTSR